MNIETWKPVIIDRYPYPYEVSSHGRVRNMSGRILRPWKRGQRKGTYLCVALCDRGWKIKIDIQRLVALHFLENPDDKPEVNHLDLDHFNNRADNLQWCTRGENMRHRYFMEAHMFLGCEEAVL